MATSKTSRKRSGPSPKAVNRAADTVEWIVAGVAMLLVVALVGFLGYEAITRSGGRPDLAVTHLESTPTRTGLAVLVEVENFGQTAAAAVEVAGEARTDGQNFGTVTIDYVPAESKRQATIVLPAEIPPDEMRLRVLGYSDP